MKLNTAIFDMDGLLIDSEPLWSQAANEVFSSYGVSLTEEQHLSTTGLRTSEFVQWWFKYYNLSDSDLKTAEDKIFDRVTELIRKNFTIMPGVHHIFQFFKNRNFKIGIASSSPMYLIEFVANELGVKKLVDGMASAEHLAYGKPHPQVYLDCASILNVEPAECVCFEDSFNGMIAAKAARMKCVVVPAHQQQKEEKWGAADLRLSSLQNFGDLHLRLLS